MDINKESRDPVQSLAYFEQSARQVRNLVIPFGQVAEPWLRSRVRTALRVVGEQLIAGEGETL